MRGGLTWFHRQSWPVRAVIVVTVAVLAQPVIGLLVTASMLLVYGVVVWAEPWGVPTALLATAGVVVLWRSPLWAQHRTRRCLRRRLRRWPEIAHACGLVSGHQYPGLRLTAMEPDASRWEAMVGIPAGMTPGDIGRRSEALSHALGAVSVRVLPASPGTALLVADMVPRLVAPVDPGPLGAPVSLDAVPVGMTVDGAVWAIRLRQSHVLVAGASGSGKGSVVWGLLWSLAPMITSGAVQVWAIDGKGGVELGRGAGLFTRLATSVDAAEALLADAATAMQQRAARMVGSTRLHTPGSSSPQLVIMIDELAAITSYVTDAKKRRSIASSLALLLSQGRALGVTVVGCVQNPSKETVGACRDLFLQRVALRLTARTEPAMVLNDEALATGADPCAIPSSRPGTAYAVTDAGQVVQARASWISDEHIDHLTRTVHAPTRSVTDLTPGRIS